jgi:predicted extracellular nuclease
MTNNYQPVSKRTNTSGNTTITTFNLYNLFDADKDVQVRIDGEWQRPFLPIHLAKLSLAIQFELALPQIIAVQEVSSTAVLQQLADKVNQSAGTDYRAIAPPTSDRRGIRIGFLYDRQRVDLVQSYQLSGPEVAAAFGPDSPNPGREPLAGVFRVQGQTVTIVNNHFKSNYIPDERTAETKKLLEINLAQRMAQARVARQFANTLLDADPQALVMITGDLNTSRRGGPAEKVMVPVDILAGTPPERPFTNLLPLKQDIHEYTKIWKGENEILDHMLVSPALLERFVGVDALHFNAAHPEALWFDGETAVRSSDHDPVEGRFQL